MIIGRREFDTEHNTYIMGILNVTPDSFSDQCCIGFYRLGKSFVGSPQHLFCICIIYRACGISLTSDFQPFIISLYQKKQIPCQHCIHPFFPGLQWLCFRKPQAVCFHCLIHFFRIFPRHVDKHPSKHRFFQDQIRYGIFHIDG